MSESGKILSHRLPLIFFFYCYSRVIIKKHRPCLAFTSWTYLLPGFISTTSVLRLPTSQNNTDVFVPVAAAKISPSLCHDSSEVKLKENFSEQLDGYEFFLKLLYFHCYFSASSV